MKILVVIDSLQRGGAERIVVDLVTEFEKKNFQFLVVSLSDNIPLAHRLETQGIKYDCLGFKETIYNFSAIRKTGYKLRRIIDIFQPDIIHSNLYFSDVISRLYKPMNIPSISTLHNIDPWWTTKLPKAFFKTALDKVTGKWANTRFVAVSDAVRNAAISGLNIPEKKIRVIPNGIELQKFHKDWNRQRNEIEIIQVGRMYKQKGHEISLKAFKIISTRFPNANLIFLGDGPLRSQLTSLCNELEVSKSVRFVGETDDIKYWLDRASVFWMPSIWEGLGIACLEAMAAGLPVVVSNTGGLGEIVKNGVTGFQIPVGDFELLAAKTVELLMNSQLRHKIGNAAQSYVETNYSIECCAENYLKAYSDNLSGLW